MKKSTTYFSDQLSKDKEVLDTNKGAIIFFETLPSYAKDFDKNHPVKNFFYESQTRIGLESGIMSYLFSRVTLANEISEYSGSKKVISSLFTDSKKVANDTIDIKGIFTESISKDCNALLKSKMSWNYQNIEYVVNAMLECKGTIFTTGIGKTNGTLSFHKFKRPGKFLS